MTKILYISFALNDYDESLGFNKKDIDKIKGINELPDTQGTMITFVYGLKEDKWLAPYHLLKKVDVSNKRKYFDSYRVNKTITKAMMAYLKSEQYDVVLMRYRMATKSIYKLTKLLGTKVFFEHNSKELSEFLFLVNERRKNLKFSIKPGYFIYLLEGKMIPQWMEKYYGPKIRKNTSSGFAVTHEIGDYQKMVLPSYEIAVIANGVNFNQDNIHESVPFDGTKLNMFMLLGTKASWHGVDRLIAGLKNYKGSIDINIDIIGYFIQENRALADQLNVSRQIRFLDPISPDEMTEKLRNYHVALGTLGLHRKNLNEASTLKVRESLMRGFPVVLGYRDTDFLVENEVTPFLHILPSDESPVDFEEVVSFASRVLTSSEITNEIHSKSQSIIDYEVKIDQMMQFIAKYNEPKSE